MDKHTLSLFDRPVTTAHPKRCAVKGCKADPGDRSKCPKHRAIAKETAKRYHARIAAEAKRQLFERAAQLPKRKRPLSRRVELLRLGAKLCNMCKEAKPLDDFAIRWKGRETRQSQCRACHAKYMTTWSKTPQGRAVQAAWQAKRPEGDTEHALRWRRKNPAKAKCHRIFAKAKARGEIMPQPCEVCGAVDVHGHHTDYAKPLDVMWLCAIHHAAWHKIHGEGKNG